MIDRSNSKVVVDSDHNEIGGLQRGRENEFIYIDITRSIFDFIAMRITCLTVIGIVADS